MEFSCFYVAGFSYEESFVENKEFLCRGLEEMETFRKNVKLELGHSR